MADPLYELLLPYFDKSSPRLTSDPTTSSYLSRLTTLPLSSLTTTEPESLASNSHSINRSLQSLSKRSHNSIISSSTHLSTLSSNLPSLASSTHTLLSTLPKLDSAAVQFSTTYNPRTNTSNPVLTRRRESLLLSTHISRLTDILDLPTLLNSAISTPNYAAALDLNAHIRRLHALYPSSPLISSIELEAEEAMKEMTSNLIASLRTSTLKLAAAMRTISFLRRVAPDLDADAVSLGSLFLVCRLANLRQMLSALEPLRELADQETLRLQRGGGHGGEDKEREKVRGKWEGGQQTERFLKRYIEIFREQSFAIISMYRSIFPSAHNTSTSTSADEATLLKTLGREHQISKSEEEHGKLDDDDPLMPLPGPLNTFVLKLVSMLEETLQAYLPNVRDRSSRDSLLTQVLYCAGSLGRLGGDFSLVLASLGGAAATATEEKDVEDEQKEKQEEEGDGEWVEIMRKHRVLAGRLELMVGSKEH